LSRRPGAADDVREHEEYDEEAREREDREHDERVGEPEREKGAAVERFEVVVVVAVAESRQ
jgi:hypothetical protein